MHDEAYAAILLTELQGKALECSIGRYANAGSTCCIQVQDPQPGTAQHSKAQHILTFLVLLNNPLHSCLLPGLRLGTKAPAKTPNDIDFSFLAASCPSTHVLMVNVGPEST